MDASASPSANVERLLRAGLPAVVPGAHVWSGARLELDVTATHNSDCLHPGHRAERRRHGSADTRKSRRYGPAQLPEASRRRCCRALGPELAVASTVGREQESLSLDPAGHTWDRVDLPATQRSTAAIGGPDLPRPCPLELFESSQAPMEFVPTGHGPLLNASICCPKSRFLRNRFDIPAVGQVPLALVSGRTALSCRDRGP